MKFYLNEDCGLNYEDENNLSLKVENSFTLNPTTWDDYSLWCEFVLFYCDSTKTAHKIGKVKIISKKTEEKIKAAEAFEIVKTKSELAESFIELSTEFCSLGQYCSYYENLKKILPNDYKSVLIALRDCAVDPRILEDFSLHYPLSFHRAARRDLAQEALLKARPILRGVGVNAIHNFTYKYKPAYSQEFSNITFNFENIIREDKKHDFFDQRIYAVIGKNGTGKTGLLNHLAKDIPNENNSNFKPCAPIFQKIMYLSSSCFDNEPDVDKDERYNYIYSGISSRKEESARIFIKDKVLKFYNLINRCGREDFLIKSFIKLLPDTYEEVSADEDKIDIDKLLSSLDYLSSGECIQIMHLFTIIANIFSGTLLLFDEPETHLHPNAINNLISTLIYILEEFNSYAIISTHSPMIIQNLRAKEVITATRYGDKCVFSSLPFESLGNNLSSITDCIFKGDAITPAYKGKILRLHNNGMRKEELISKITDDPEDMSLALQLFIDVTYKD